MTRERLKNKLKAQLKLQPLAYFGQRSVSDDNSHLFGR